LITEKKGREPITETGTNDRRIDNKKTETRTRRKETRTDDRRTEKNEDKSQ
jgi:hypothetical protein